MLYRFQSKVAGDVLMLQPQAQELLRIMGKDTGPQGILLPEQMPAALQALKAATAEAAPPPASDHDDEAKADANDAAAVGLKQRAWPLMQLIEASLAARADVVWGV